MNILIVGGGNIGTLMAAEFAHKGHKVCIYTSKPELWSKQIEVYDEEKDCSYTAEINCITNDLKAAVNGQDLMLITLPSTVQEKFSEELLPYVSEGMKIGVIPGYGGAEFIFSEHIKKGAILFGFQRVHAIARLKEYGHSVRLTGHKTQLQVAAIPQRYTSGIKGMIEQLFELEAIGLPNYLNVTLTPSNPILHTTRIYSMFKDYEEGKTWTSNILFYREWTDEASKLLIECDEELQNICKKLLPMDLSFVKSLKVHYESYTIEEMTKKISNIEAFKSIYSPMKEIDGQWIPDWQSRYFESDFPYGLYLIQQFGDIVSVETPQIDLIMKWYNAWKGTEKGIDIKDKGIKTIDSIYDFYGSLH